MGKNAVHLLFQDFIWSVCEFNPTQTRFLGGQRPKVGESEGTWGGESSMGHDNREGSYTTFEQAGPFWAHHKCMYINMCSNLCM